jgi:hypothetical protein
MSCEHYKKALIETAAQQSDSLITVGGDGVPAALTEHLQTCPDCRVAFAQEQSLFAAIDASLHSTANAEIPPSLFPRVRAQIETSAPPIIRWSPVSFALAAAALLTFLLVGKAIFNNPVQQGIPVAVDFHSEPTPPQISSPIAQPNPSPRHNRPTSFRTERIRRDASSNSPIALVPPSQRQAIDQLIHGLQTGKIDGQTFLAAHAPVNDLEIKPIDVPAVDVKSLETSVDTDNAPK